MRKITEELRLMRQATADTKRKAQSKRKNKKQTGVQKKQTDVRKKRGILKKPQKSTKGRKHEKLSIYKKKRCLSADKKRVKSSHDVTVAQRIVLSGPSSGQNNLINIESMSIYWFDQRNQGFFCFFFYKFTRIV